MTNLVGILQDGPAQARLWAKVDVRGADECWPWNGATDGDYGQFWWRGKLQRATCVTWVIANNREWPEGMFGCHTCDNKICVNPAHIWPGTQRENMQDMAAKGRGPVGGSLPRKFCPKGHAYEGENVVRLKDGWRKCATCVGASKAKYREKIARAVQDTDRHGENIPMVAVGLTKAQRAAIVGAQYREADGVWHPAGWYSNSDRRVRSNLSSKKLIHDYLRPWNRLTERGIAVRDHLISYERARTALGNKETDRHG